MSNTNFRADRVASSTCWHCGRDRSKHAARLIETTDRHGAPLALHPLRCPDDKE